MINSSQLLDLLSKDNELLGSIRLTLHDFQKWFEDRNLVFFPEYTDHGPKHIAEVIATAGSLIKDESWKFLTPEDAAVLILSIVLHDCAMHLSEDGFISLVKPSAPRPIIAGFNDEPWPELWASFLSEASRFDARKLKSIFGDTEPVHSPPLDPRDMSLRDRFLIGEFLRRNHHRLAHEIALWGVPGPADNQIGLVRVPKGLDNLAGLVARSHGLPLRLGLETLDPINRRECRKVHVPFLMAIIRVADYIQIHSDRAPQQILKVRSLKSPISQGEWKTHEAIENIHCTHDDPEALVVVAKPQDVKIYLRLRRLLSGLQEELDASWAVLGEVYGRIEGLQELGLTMRRVRSNLDNKNEFSKTVSYYPDKILFEADPEILKLLIAPLYGDEPGIAIRELVQNAVDACLELTDYLNNVSSESIPALNSRVATVTVYLQQDDDGNRGWLTVADNGIGMTPEVIKNYFLKAGASFRRSDAWKKQHETSEGKSRVRRSGRFGIGILAAFLLGDTLEIKTRHVSSSEDNGIQFSCSIDDEAIELQRVNLPTVGTSIKICLSKTLFNKLREKSSLWDWYFLKEPIVERKITAQDWTKKQVTKSLEHKLIISSAHSDLPDSWHRIRHNDFDDIHWHYQTNAEKYEPAKGQLFCNGIKIAGRYNYESIKKQLSWPFSLETPLLSIFDPDGNLPLNLERSTLTRNLPFERELLEDICRDFIAYLLVHTPTLPLSNLESSKAYQNLSYNGLPDYSNWFWCTSEGISLADRWFLNQAAPKNLYLVPSLLSFRFNIPKENANIFSFEDRPNFGNFDQWIRFVLTGTGWQKFWLSDAETFGRRIIISAKYEARIKELKVLPKSFLSKIQEEWRNDDWLILCTRNCPKPDIDFQDFANQIKPDQFTGLGEWYIESVPIKPEDEESVLVKIWKGMIEGAVIPFQQDKRKKLLRKAFEELDTYIASHKVLSEK